MDVDFCFEKGGGHFTEFRFGGDFHGDNAVFRKCVFVKAEQIARGFRVVDNESHDGALRGIQLRNGNHMNIAAGEAMNNLVKSSDFIVGKDGELHN